MSDGDLQPTTWVVGPRPTTVLLVEDSPVERQVLWELLGSVPGVRVIGEARSGREGLLLAGTLRPDCVLMDLGLPGMDGVEAITAIMSECPTPVVVFTGEEDDARRQAAIDAGAVDVVRKPGGTGAPLDVEALSRRVRQAAKVGRPGGPVRLPRPATAPESRGSATGRDTRARTRPAKPPADPSAEPPSVPPRLVVVGASTGGPPALARLLAPLRPDSPVPVLVVQHMAHGFVEGLADWLDSVLSVPVRVAQQGKRLRPGVVALAPSQANTLVSSALRVTLGEVEERQWHVPSVDVTFRSVAESLRPEADAVLLTGMGRDGAAGMRALRDAGAWTLGQDEETSVVYGMPRAALAAGGVCEQLGIDALARRLSELAAGAPSVDRPLSAGAP